ncbi:G2/mitotic-specific cyclin [Ceratocystis pirilliformis]|uniref:G2/mitotic-specific cyclin n=1 Tax=Ceratocystis pirilliformis TaxID=259994 RepID=A0ABR3YLN2_9PEZI
MPPSEMTTRRMLSNENDNSAAVNAIVRAKASALNAEPAAKGLQTKKVANGSGIPRKRAALGDVSNMGKGDVVEGKKKGLVSKATSQVTSRVSTRSAVARANGITKEKKQTIELKRAASTSGVQKRKALASAASEAQADGQPSRKRISVESDKGTKAAVAVPHVPMAPIIENITEKKTIYPSGVRNLEDDDFDDPLMVAEYANDIFEYLRQIEPDTLPHPDYMDVQDDLEWKTRAILVDWLVEVHTRFHLLPETLFLAINIADRFMSQKTVHLERLQLVGMTAMFIAAKYEEIISPSVTSFRELAEGGFSEEEILSAERAILATLDYNMSYPNPMNFLRRISKADNYDIEARTIGKYLMEISILDHRLIGYPGSLLAAGAMYLARLILDRGEWDETLAFYAGYSEEEIEPIVATMVDYMVRPTTHEAFFRKYACKKFLKASIISRNWAKANMRHFRISNPMVSVDDLA